MSFAVKNEICDNGSGNYLPDALSPCFQVRRSCAMLMENESCWTSSSSTTTTTTTGGGTRSVDIDMLRLREVAQSIVSSSCSSTVQWDEDNWHYTASSQECVTYLTEEQRNERVALYVMVLDALNFCFWPTPGLQHEHLAIALQAMATKDEHLLLSISSVDEIDWNDAHYALSPLRLSCMTCEEMHQHLDSYFPPGFLLPNLQERCRLCNELGYGLLHSYGGKALVMIQSVHFCADRLVHVVTQTFPGFRDTAVDDRGRQVAFYKRAQILVGDLWASLRDRCASCDFNDIHKLTMFADYRVPQLLRYLQILVYSPALAKQVDDDSAQLLMAGSMDELYIRAATVVAVEKMVLAIKDSLLMTETKTTTTATAYNKACATHISSKEDATSPEYWCAMKLDWHLWQMGEALEKQGSLSHHHRVKTIFY